MGIDHRLLEAASLVTPEGIQIIPVETAQKWGLDNSRAGVTRPSANTGLAAADLFHLRSECNALGGQMIQDERLQTAKGYSWFFHYDTETGSCYVQINLTDSTGQYEWLYDAQSRHFLADAIQPPEMGFITGAPGADGHAAYLKAKAFIESHMQDGG